MSRRATADLLNIRTLDALGKARGSKVSTKRASKKHQTPPDRDVRSFEISDAALDEAILKVKAQFLVKK